MKKFVPITPRQDFDLTDLLSLTGMIAVGYMFLTYGPIL